MKFLCKLRGHNLVWIEENIRCKRCKEYGSDIINRGERATMKTSD